MATRIWRRCLSIGRPAAGLPQEAAPAHAADNAMGRSGTLTSPRYSTAGAGAPTSFRIVGGIAAG
jgi:hypothetical protein